MEDRKDNSERLRYFQEELKKQIEEVKFHESQVEKLNKSFELQEKEIKYNNGWVDFHNKSIENHSRSITYAGSDEERDDQEKKLQFHVRQISDHHNTVLEYHRMMLNFIIYGLEYHREGILICEKNIEFLERKIRENSDPE